MGLIDFHAHVLPGIDDGAANLEETRLILLSQKEQGIDKVVVTPHYEQNESIRRFIYHRDKALHSVKKHIQDDIPELIPGVEVSLYCGLSEEPDARKLCIGQTDYMLIEMPYFFWNHWDYEELFQLRKRQGIYPIIAHLDRYANSPRDVNNFSKLLDEDVLVQVNSSSLLNFSTFQIVKALWRNRAVTVLGSDVHDLKKRPCTLKKACDKFSKKFGAEALESVMTNAEDILNNKSFTEFR